MHRGTGTRLRGQCVCGRVPGPWEWPECDQFALDEPGSAGFGRLKLVLGIVKIRSAATPSTGHAAGLAASLAGRETSNSSAQLGQRNA